MEQASSLIFRGKTHAARGDYRLERIIVVMEHLSDVARAKAVRDAISREEEVRQQTLGVEAREEIAERFIPPSAPTQTLIPPPAPTQTLIPPPPMTPIPEPTLDRPDLSDPTLQTIPLFVESRGGFRSKAGKDIPMGEVVIVDRLGNVVRQATKEERTLLERPHTLTDEGYEQIGARSFVQRRIGDPIATKLGAIRQFVPQKIVIPATVFIGEKTGITKEVIGQVVGQVIVPDSPIRLSLEPQSFREVRKQVISSFVVEELSFAQRDPVVAAALWNIGKIARIKNVIPPTIVQDLRKVKQPSGFELQIPVIKGGKEFTLSTFRIETEIAPRRVVLGERELIKQGRSLKIEGLGGRFSLQQKSITEDLGFLGKTDVLTIKAPKVAISETILPIINQGTAMVVTTKAMGKTGRLEIVTGSSKQISRSDLKSLDKISEFTFKRLAEDRIDFRVPTKLLPEFFRKDSKLFTSQLQVMAPQKALGKQRTLFTTATKLDKIESTALFERYKSVTTFKDVTKPFARAIGKTPKLKMDIVVLKPIVVGGSDLSANIIKTSGFGKKTLLSKTFAQPIVIPKAPPKSVSKGAKGLQTISTPTSIKPIPAGSITSITASIQTKELSSIKPLAITKQAQTISTISKVKQDIKVRTKFATIQVPKSAQKITQATKQTITPKLKISQKIQTVQKQTQKQTLKLQTQLRTVQRQAQKQTLKLQAQFITPAFTIPRRPISRTKPVREPTPFFRFKFKQPKTFKISTAKFGVSIRRFGTFRSIGKGLSLGKALGLGRERVAGTLAATFKLTPTKKGISISQNIPTPRGFKRKKGLIFIEKRKHRLSRRGEIQEIQIARRIKV